MSGDTDVISYQNEVHYIKLDMHSTYGTKRSNSRKLDCAELLKLKAAKCENTEKLRQLKNGGAV